MLMARSLVLPVESFKATMFLIVYIVKVVASGTVKVIQKLSKSSSTNGRAIGDSNIEKLVRVSNVVSCLAPFLSSSLDSALIFEVGINMLYLANVPRGKSSGLQSIIAMLTLWDRQEFSSARESIVRAVVTNLHLLDLHMQVSLAHLLVLFAC